MLNCWCVTWPVGFKRLKAVIILRLTFQFPFLPWSSLFALFHQFASYFYSVSRWRDSTVSWNTTFSAGYRPNWMRPKRPNFFIDVFAFLCSTTTICTSFRPSISTHDNSKPLHGFHKSWHYEVHLTFAGNSMLLCRFSCLICRWKGKVRQKTVGKATLLSRQLKRNKKMWQNAHGILTVTTRKVRGAFKL